MFDEEKEYLYIVKYKDKVVREGKVYAPHKGKADEKVYEMLFDEARVSEDCAPVKVYFKGFEVQTWICEDWRDIVRSALDKLEIIIMDKKLVEYIKKSK